MADQDEILRYRLDIADAEQKVSRLKQLFDELATRRASGQDTLALEDQIGKETAALGALAPKQQQSKTATDELAASKEKLASVVGLLGGQFGGMVGQLSNVLQLVSGGTKLVAGFAAALAGIAIATQVYQSVQAEQQKTIDKQRELNEALQEQNRIAAARRASIGETLDRFGALTPENEEQANQLAMRLRKQFGFDSQQAGQAAAMAVVTGRTGLDQAAVLAQLGDKVAGLDPTKLVETLAKVDATAGATEAIQAALAARRGTETAKDQMAIAEAETSRGDMGPVGRTFEALRSAGRLPGDVKSVDDFQRRVDEIPKLQEFLKNFEGYDASDQTKFAAESERLNEALRLRGMLNREMTRDRVGAFPVVEMPAGSAPASVASPAAQTTNFINVVGTVFNTPERKVSGPTRTMGLGVSQAIDNKRGLE